MSRRVFAAAGLVLLIAAAVGAQETLEIPRTHKICHLDSNCLNRLHPDIAPAARARQGS